jgi:pilus assembly protein Flp/PilA
MMGDCIERLWTSFVSRLSDEHGQTLVEYAVLVAFIAVVVLAGVQLLGTNLLSFFSSFANAL